jgi:hypothetical protein
MAPSTSKMKTQDKQLTAALEAELGAKPDKHHLGDTASLKRALDDTVAQVGTAIDDMDAAIHLCG